MSGAGVEWPPFPSVTLGAGQWRRIVEILVDRDTRESRRLAGRITSHIERRYPPKAPPGPPPLPNAYADVLNENTADTDQWDAEERAAEGEK